MTEFVTQPGANSPQAAHGSRRRFWLWGGIVVIVMIGAVLWYWGTRRSIGKVVIPEAIPGIQQTVIQKYVTYEGKYFVFKHEESFQPRFVGKIVRWPFLEQQLLSRDDVEGQKIAVVVQDIGQGTLEEYSSYRLRVLESKTYTREKIEKNGLSMTIFTKSEPVFEAGAFWYFQGKAMSIVLTSPTQSTGLREELFELLDTLSFREGS